MSAATLPPSVRPDQAIGTVKVTRHENVVFNDVSWEYYVYSRDIIDSKTKITFDRGRMEVMASPVSLLHADDNYFIMVLLHEYLMTTDLAFQGVQDVTLGRSDLRRGCEPDGCYYIRATPPPRGTRDIDLSMHNPPDLVIEIDLTSHSVDKEPIYAAFGVAEVWRWENEQLRVRRLNDGSYTDAEASDLLPELPIAALAEHMHLARTEPQHEVLKRWRHRLRDDATEAEG